jgi:hypothetical protein
MTKNIIIAFTAFMLLTGVAISSDSRIKRAQFTTSVQQREPVDNINKIETSYRTLTFFSEIVNCKGCKVYHQWWFQGEKKYEKKGSISSNRYRWWTKKRVQASNPGTWTVKVLINGKVVHSASLNYFAPSMQQQRAAPIQKRLKRKSVNRCESKLKYYHNKSKENPDDPYYAFMFRKWGKRCFETE